MFGCKNKSLLGVCLFMLVHVAYANVYNKNLVFVNCTGADIQLNTISHPYKFSLSPNKKAKNGYSDVYSLTIPSRSVLKYQYMTVYFNGYIDGSLSLNFSGGVTGHAALKQKQQSVQAVGYGVCSTGEATSCVVNVGINKIVGVTDAPDIEFLSGEEIVSVYADGSLSKSAMVINLGCNSGS